MIVDRLRLVGLGGSNTVMMGELSRLARRALDGERSRELLGTPPVKVGPGALVYPFAPDLAAVAVRYHRTSARVLWDLFELTETRLEPLYEGLYADLTADRRPWFEGVKSLSVHAFGTGPVEAGERQVVGTVKNAFVDAARARGLLLEVDPTAPDLVVHARPSEDRSGRPTLVISLDLAGRPMHERGYRLHSGPAPLREDLAAFIVMLARHDARSEAVIDPLAGSGTLLVEAALLGRGSPVWMSGRSPLATRLSPIQKEYEKLGGSLFDDTRAELHGAEIDGETYAAMERAVETAGARQKFQGHLGDFREWDAGRLPKGALIVANPPYGERLGDDERELEKLYRDLGRFCRSLRPARMAFIVGDPSHGRGGRELFLRSFGGRPRVRKPVSNGPLRGEFLLYDGAE